MCVPFFYAENFVLMTGKGVSIPQKGAFNHYLAGKTQKAGYVGKAHWVGVSEDPNHLSFKKFIK